MSQNTKACKKMALLMQPRPKLWNRNRKLEGALNIILQKKLTLRPYHTYENKKKKKKMDLGYPFSRQSIRCFLIISTAKSFGHRRFQAISAILIATRVQLRPSPQGVGALFQTSLCMAQLLLQWQRQLQQ